MVDVSICMVSLNCWRVFEDCLASLKASDSSVTYEIINVDNASTDETCERLERDYPEVRLIRNERNVGFTRATNQGIEASNGRYILWLNTDTILRPDTLRRLVDYLDANPKVGIVGPKVLNADGSFQPQCRRGLPTPWSALAYMTRLHRWRPRSPHFNGYLLSHLSVDESTRVEAVSGCCLLARREVWEQIGPLDNEIFGFGEDIDWCVRARQAGWEVWYYPKAEIIHLKGQGGAHAKPYHKAWGIHQAMWVFYRKHLRAQYSPVTTLAVRAGIGASLAASAVMIWGKRQLRGRQRAQAA